MRVKTTSKWKPRFPAELVSMPAPRHTGDSLYVYMFDWHPRAAVAWFESFPDDWPR